MSKRFPCQCPRAKQIVGQKNWIGWAGSFAFPGFKGNWVNTYGEYGQYTGGAWQETADGGAISPPATEWNFAVGDLVVQEFRAEGPFTDYLTGLSQSYPKYYNVYICKAAITGSATRPSDDTAHFAAWDYNVFYVNGSGQLIWHGGSGAYYDGIPDPGGPSGWPSGAVAMRGLFSSLTDTAQLELTITTTLANFPIMPAAISGLIAALGCYNDTAAAFNLATDAEAGASGAFAYDWTFANHYDGTAATYTAPASPPSASQAKVLFPAVPGKTNLDWAPSGHWEGDNYIIDALFQIGSPTLPGLVTWSVGSSSISFEFAAWDWYSDVEYRLGTIGALASAPGTITQTLTLGGAAYTLSDVASQAAALRDAISFDAIDWRTSWKNTWDTTGAVVSSLVFAATAETAITASGAAGTPIKWAVAVNGCPFIAGATQYFSTKALVDVCGNYCTRTYQEGMSGPASCSNGNVDGYAPFTLAPPGTAGQSAAVYSGQC